jgi:hypothetical protein
MSKTANKVEKVEKVELVENKAGKAGFENAPKLFSKWNYDDIKVNSQTFRLKIPASLIILLQNQLKHKFSSLTLLEDIKPKSSEKLFVQLLKDLLDQCNSMEEILVKRLKPSELFDMHSKLFTY